MANLCALEVSKLYPSLENHPGPGSLLCTQETEHNNSIVGRVRKAGRGTHNSDY